MRHPRRNEVFRDVGSALRDKDEHDFVEVIEDDARRRRAPSCVCTDGLTDMIPSTTIERMVRQHRRRSRQRVSTALVAAANEAGGHDNVTVVYAEAAGFAAAFKSGTAAVRRRDVRSGRCRERGRRRARSLGARRTGWPHARWFTGRHHPRRARCAAPRLASLPRTCLSAAGRTITSPRPTAVGDASAALAAAVQAAAGPATSSGSNLALYARVDSSSPRACRPGGPRARHASLFAGHRAASATSVAIIARGAHGGASSGLAHRFHRGRAGRRGVRVAGPGAHRSSCST